MAGGAAAAAARQSAALQGTVAAGVGTHLCGGKCRHGGVCLRATAGPGGAARWATGAGEARGG